MVIRHEDDEPVGPVWQDLQAGRERAAAEDADVGDVLRHGAHYVLAQALLQLDLNSRVRGQEVPDVGRQVLDYRRDAGVETDLPAQPLRMIEEIAFELS